LFARTRSWTCIAKAIAAAKRSACNAGGDERFHGEERHQREKKRDRRKNDAGE